MMTEQQFDERLARIEEGHASRREQAAAWRDQEMARLFEESEWTQQKIARKVGKTQRWVSYRLLFGRFLSFRTTCSKDAPGIASLTEGAFRTLWKKTGSKKESARFAEVLTMLEKQPPPGPKPPPVNKVGLAAAVRELFEDGKWRTVRQAVEAIRPRFPGLPDETLAASVRWLRSHPPRGYQIEVKHLGKVGQYRLRRAGRDLKEVPALDVDRFLEGVVPIIEELKTWGGQSEWHQSPGALRRLAVQLERLIAPFTEGVHP
jgi:hypothetical protein